MTHFHTANEQIVLLTPGQVFTVKDGKISYQQCWMVGGAETPEPDTFNEENDYGDSGDYEDIDLGDCVEPQAHCTEFLIPLLPHDENFQLFVDKRHELSVEGGFLDRQNWSFKTHFGLDQFIREASSLDLNCEMPEQIQRLRKELQNVRFYPQLNYNQPFDRHFYLAPDEDDNLLFMRFEDNAYRPETNRAKFRGNAGIKYRDLLKSAEKWARLGAGEIKGIFRKTSSETIDAMNMGLANLCTIEQIAVGARPDTASPAISKAGAYRVVSRATEIAIVPTVWLDAEKRRVWMNYDFWAEWKTKPSGEIYADLGVFQAWHAPDHPQSGLITKRYHRAKKY